jgi:Glycine rich protein
MDANARRSTVGRPAGRRRNTASLHRRTFRRRHLRISAILVGASIWLVSFAPAKTRTVTTVFRFTRGPQSYVVPTDVCRIRIVAIGASGGESGTAGTPGAGARATALFVVKPGVTLVVRVGGEGGAAAELTPGSGGWNGGGAGGSALDGSDGHPGRAGSGGGGATDVRRGGDGLDNRIIVAGGGSGGAGGGIGGPIGTGGGNGGDRAGQDGFAVLGSVNPATGGSGATQTTGGVPGANAPNLSIAATAGSLGVGGNGAAGGISGGGGGGGGLYGGGGGGSTNSPLGGGEGGGGSGYGPSNTTFRTGVWGSYGSGRATISYDPGADNCEALTTIARERTSEKTRRKNTNADAPSSRRSQGGRRRMSVSYSF